MFTIDNHFWYSHENYWNQWWWSKYLNESSWSFLIRNSIDRKLSFWSQSRWLLFQQNGHQKNAIMYRNTNNSTKPQQLQPHIHLVLVLLLYVFQIKYLKDLISKNFRQTNRKQQQQHQLQLLIHFHYQQINQILIHYHVH